MSFCNWHGGHPSIFLLFLALALYTLIASAYACEKHSRWNTSYLSQRSRLHNVFQFPLEFNLHFLLFLHLNSFGFFWIFPWNHFVGFPILWPCVCVCVKKSTFSLFFSLKPIGRKALLLLYQNQITSITILKYYSDIKIILP